jgi:fatty acid desaturase
MFSVKHLEAHRANGYFAPPYRKVFGRYVEFFLGHLYGGVPELDSTMHMRLHHREHNGPEDIADSRRYDRTSRWDFFTGYLAANLWSALGISAWRYFEAKGQEKNQRRMLQGMARHGFFVSVVFLYNWQIGVLFVLVPFLVMNFIQAIIGWVQHAFYDPDNPNEYLAHTITVIDSVNFMNEGYHLCHHRRAGLHWTEMPGQFEKLREEMKQAGSLVFRDIDFLGVFLEMTLFRRLDVLADRLATWEPMAHDEKVALLRRRTQPIVSHASAAGMPRRPR